MQLLTHPSKAFDALNNYFDKIYVLTIPRNEARRQFLNEHLAGLQFEYFYGADGKQLDLDELARRNHYDPARAKVHYTESLRKFSFVSDTRDLLLNEVACALSHKMMYEETVRSHYDKVLILEDDVAVVPAHLSLTETVLNQLPNDWALFYAGYLPTMLTEKWGKVVGMRRQLVVNLYQLGARWGKIPERYFGYAKPYRPHVTKGGAYWGTHAYAIRQETAQQLIRLQSPLTWIADHLLLHATTSGLPGVYAASPELFVQNRDTFGSSIWN